MYPKHTLYKEYKNRQICRVFSHALPDITKKITLERMNAAVNLCEKWDSFLDVGGGIGDHSAALSAIFKKGVLVEIGGRDEHAELTRLCQNLEIFDGRIEDYRNEDHDNKHDFILIADVFEHILDIHNFVKQLSGLQTIGGVIYIMTPNPLFCGPATESKIFYKKSEFGHVKHYTEQEIVNQMRSAGYEEIFHLHEEAPFRDKVKRLVKAISRRDETLRNIPVLKYFRLVTLPIAKILFSILEHLVYNDETSSCHDRFDMMTRDIAFKKI